MDNLYIFKSDVDDFNKFELMISLYNCRISQEDTLYFVLEGTSEDIDTFKEFWIHRNEMN